MEPMLRRLLAPSILLFCGLVLPGCGFLGSDESPASQAGSTEDAVESPANNAKATAETQTPEDTSSSAELRLQLGIGQPVPLHKTVYHTLQQQTPQGVRTSQSVLDLRVTLWVDDINDEGEQLLSVRYDRVRYWQDIAGETFEYDSTNLPERLALEAIPYHGLVNNGYSFWIDKDHRLIRPVGFADFLKRCIAGVPPARQQEILLSFAYATEESIASFVDDTMGLLPKTGRKVAPGDSWNQEQRLPRPMPLYIRSKYSLNKLNDHVAEIDIAGSIATAQTFGPATADPNSRMKVTVKGGHTTGYATIDRKTGLPMKSDIKRLVDMYVQHADGHGFAQQKITRTTVELYLPQAERTTPSAAQPAGAIRQASGIAP